MTTRDLIRHLKGGNWVDEGQVQRFALGAQSVGRDEVIELLGYLKNGSKQGSSPIAHKHRCRAFIAVVEANKSAELFGPLVDAMKDADLELRNALATLIPKVNDRQSHAELCALLKSKDRSLRKVAAQCLGEIGGKQALDILLGYVADDGFQGRLEASIAAAQFGRHHAIPVLGEVIARGSSKERITALGLLSDPQLIEKDLRNGLRAILPALNDNDPTVVVEAIRAFCASCGETHYFKSIAPFLDSPERRLMGAAVLGLGRFTTPRAIHALERAFRIGPNAIRLAALNAAKQIGTDEVLPVIVDALGHRDLNVRTQAGEVLAELSTQGKIDVGRSIVWLLRSRDINVRRMAVEVAARVKDAAGEIWPRLLSLLKDEDWWVRERVSDALVEMAGVALAPYVADLLHDPSDVVRRYAVLLLGRIKNPDAIGALVLAAQNDEDWWVREEAIKACGLLGDGRAIPYIADLLHTEPHLQLVCLSALGALKAKEIAAEVGELLAEDAAVNVLEAALNCLAQLDDAAQTTIVARLQNHPHGLVRTAARKLITRWGGSIADDTMRTIASALGKLELLLHAAVEAGADDLILTAERQPYIKREGAISPISEVPVSAAELEEMLMPLLSEDQKQRLIELKDVDLSHQVKSQGRRFRVNIFQQTTGWSAVFRVISDTVPEIDQLGLPKTVVGLSDFADGLILVGGPTGSGKSTTLAALINRINHTSRRHIITLEDPIEFVHASKSGLVTQREIGKHSASYASVLRATLREDPDVILVGEMRDLPTISFAISAAETGHLVLATVHTVSSDKSIDRVINAYPAGQQPQVRSMLSGSLRAVLCQQLVRRADGNGRVLAVEVLLNNDAIANMIRKEKTFQIPSLIATSREQGMQSMDDELRRLLYAGVITAEEGYLKANDKETFAALIRNKP